MERMEIMKLTPDKKGEAPSGGARAKIPKVQKSASVASDVITPAQGIMRSRDQNLTPEDDGFFDLLSKFQGRRIDEQRCTLKGPVDNQLPTVPQPQTLLPKVENGEPRPLLHRESGGGPEDFLDMVAGIQGSRMNDQRAVLPRFPGLNSQAVINQFLAHRMDEDVPDDNFFEMLMRCQGSRIDDQRSSLPRHSRSAPTVPDEDFFCLIQKVQSSRLEEQRTIMPDAGDDTPPTVPPQTPGRKKKK